MNIFNKIRSMYHRQRLSCREVNEFLVAYLEGQIEDDQRQAFETHIAGCPNCRTFFDQYRLTIDLVKNEETVAVPEELVDRTLDFLRKNWRDE